MSTAAIAGVAPATEAETTVMLHWPSVSAQRILGFPIGKVMGNLMNIDAGWYVFRIGNFIALALAPLGALLYLKRVAPVVGVRYRLTNKRIVVERGVTAQEEKAIELDRFDSIEIEVDPGDEWFKSGDLVFRQGEVERFRLEGVYRPEAFKQTCWKSHRAYVGVKQATGA